MAIKKISALKILKWLNKISFHENKNSYIEAKKKYYRAIQIKKDFTPSLNNLGNLLFKEGNKEKALKYLKISRKIQPKNITILNNIAVIYMQKKLLFSN